MVKTVTNLLQFKRYCSNVLELLRNSRNLVLLPGNKCALFNIKVLGDDGKFGQNKQFIKFYHSPPL